MDGDWLTGHVIGPVIAKVQSLSSDGADAGRWWQRWRMFWMACAELFGYDGGNQWLVAHYRFVRPQ